MEPDKRISRHPALLKTVVSGMRRKLPGGQPLQIRQSKSLDLLIVADPFRRLVGPLAAPSQVLRKTVSNVRVDLTEGLAWIPKVEVVLPALQVPVHLLNQLRDRLVTLPMIGHLVQLLPFLLQSFPRRTHIEISPPAPFQVIVVAECESQKVQARSLFFHVHHPRFLPIDLQPQPALQFPLNPARQAGPLIARQHHKIIGVTHQLGTGPGPSLGYVFPWVVGVWLPFPRPAGSEQALTGPSGVPGGSAQE